MTVFYLKKNKNFKSIMFNIVLNYWIKRNLEGLNYGSLEIYLPARKQPIFLSGKNPGNKALLKINNWRALWLLFSRGSLGFTEGYLKNYWNTDDINNLMDLISKNYNSFEKVNSGYGFWKIIDKINHLKNANSLSGSKKNIHAHYDLGNDFYSKWLDETMTYSSAFFIENENKLENAQTSKYQLILDSLDLPIGSTILEIGCGWGGFLEHASRQGYKVKGITISQEQYKFASERIQNLPNHPEIELIDYRNLEDKFDAVVSIEMFEAVGSAYWEKYFNKIREVLKPNGKAIIQTIIMKEDYYEGYHDWPDFIQTYIFPGGELSSDKVFKKIAGQSNLAASGVTTMANSYAKTLEIWFNNFQQKWSEINEIGFDDKFKRTWEMYLAYCRGGFLNGQLDVVQYKLTHKS